MSNYQETFGKTIQQSFEAYHKTNPHIYRKYVDYALAWIKTGAKKISSKQIIGRIRWFMEIEVSGDEARDFKINDAFSAYYSRLFVSDFPEYNEMFEFRGLRS